MSLLFFLVRIAAAFIVLITQSSHCPVDAASLKMKVPDASDERIKIETRTAANGVVRLSALHLKVPHEAGAERAGQTATLRFNKKGMLTIMSVTGSPKIVYRVTYNKFGMLEGAVCLSGCGRKNERNLLLRQPQSFGEYGEEQIYMDEEGEELLALSLAEDTDHILDDDADDENGDRRLAMACSDCEAVMKILCNLPMIAVCGAAVLVPLPALAKVVLGVLCGAFYLLCPLAAKETCKNNFGCDDGTDEEGPDENEDAPDEQDPDCLAKELEKAGVPASCSEYMGGAQGYYGQGGLCLAQCSGGMPPLVRYACNQYCFVPCQFLDLDSVCTS